MRAESSLALVALLVPATGLADMVKCKLPDGSVYIGMSPPPNCGPVSSTQERGLSDLGVPRKPRVPLPTRMPSDERGAKQDAETARGRDIETRRSPPAVELQTIHNRLDDNGPFVEGTVANGAAFTVYNVRICIEGMCDYTAPPTLQPGSQATFQIPTHREYHVRDGAAWKITWDEVPDGIE